MTEVYKRGTQAVQAKCPSRSTSLKCRDTVWSGSVRTLTGLIASTPNNRPDKFGHTDLVGVPAGTVACLNCAVQSSLAQAIVNLVR